MSKGLSIRNELLRKSREAMFAAVQTYNNPLITFKAETFITLAVISWTYLLHAYLKEQGIIYKYYTQIGKIKRYDKTKYGAYKYWELERCLNDNNCPLDGNTKNNLKFLIGIRHEIEHQMTNKIDEYISAKLQACAINYDYYIKKLFGDKYAINDSLALTIQFSPLIPEQENFLRNNDYLNSNIKNFIVEFEDKLHDEEIKNIHYAYRVCFVPLTANRAKQADKVIEFIKADDPMAEKFNKDYLVLKETEKEKFLPKQIVGLMNNKGYTKFNFYQHTKLWKKKDAKNPKFNYGHEVRNQWYWYSNWLKIVEEYCEQNSEQFIVD